MRSHGIVTPKGMILIHFIVKVPHSLQNHMLESDAFLSIPYSHILYRTILPNQRSMRHNVLRVQVIVEFHEQGECSV